MGPRKKKPATIRGPGFNQDRQLDAEDLELLRTDTKEEAFDNLLDEWNGKITAFVLIEISQVNFSPTNSEVQLMGPIFDAPRGKSFKSAKYFELTDRFTLVFQELDCSAFTFVNGLASNHVDSSQLDFEFRHELAGPAISDETLRDAGFRGFTLRAFLAPTTSNHAKLSILLYPLNLEDLVAVAVPEAKLSFQNLAQCWEDIKKAGEPALKSSLPDLLWPEPASPPPPPLGKSYIPATLFFSSISLLTTRVKSLIKKFNNFSIA